MFLNLALVVLGILGCCELLINQFQWVPRGQMAFRDIYMECGVVFVRTTFLHLPAVTHEHRIFPLLEYFLHSKWLFDSFRL